MNLPCFHLHLQQFILEPCLALFGLARWAVRADQPRESRRLHGNYARAPISLQPTKSSTHIPEQRTLILRRDHFVRASRLANNRRALQSPNFRRAITSTPLQAHHQTPPRSGPRQSRATNAIISFPISDNPTTTLVLSVRFDAISPASWTTPFPSPRTASFHPTCTSLQRTHLDPRLF